MSGRKTKEPPICATALWWLEANYGVQALEGLTREEARALFAVRHVVELLSVADDRQLVCDALAGLLPCLRPEVLPLARHLIPCGLDWSDEWTIWRRMPVWQRDAGSSEEAAKAAALLHQVVGAIDAALPEDSEWASKLRPSLLDAGASSPAEAGALVRFSLGQRIRDLPPELVAQIEAAREEAPSHQEPQALRDAFPRSTWPKGRRLRHVCADAFLAVRREHRGALGALTGADSRALSAIAHAIEVFGDRRADEDSARRVFGGLLGSMQPQCRFMAGSIRRWLLGDEGAWLDSLMVAAPRAPIPADKEAERELEEATARLGMDFDQVAEVLSVAEGLARALGRNSIGSAHVRRAIALLMEPPALQEGDT